MEKRSMTIRQISKEIEPSISNIIEILKKNNYQVTSPEDEIDIEVIRGINKLYPFKVQYDNLVGKAVELEDVDFLKNTKALKDLKPEEIRDEINKAFSIDDFREAFKIMGILYEVMDVKKERIEIEKQKQELARGRKELEKEKKKLEEKEIKKVGKFRRSGHLTDQILKYRHPDDKQPFLPSNLPAETLKDIEIAGVEVSQIVEGIKLSPSETKVIDCLCKLLHENSQTSEVNDENYYMGNLPNEYVNYGNQRTPAPKLSFTLYELTKEYRGGETVGGRDIENMKQILTELDKKRFLLSHVETTRKKDGGRIERKIEDFKKLIHIVQISQIEYSKDNVELSKVNDTIIVLNPIFRRQIDSKFILYPNDITRRTIIAYGSHNLSDIALRLRDYLIRELSSKHYNPEISVEKLYYMLAEKWMRESRKKKVKEYTDKALETVKALGLLLSYEIKTASSGEPKIVFSLNKEWE